MRVVHHRAAALGVRRHRHGAAVVRVVKTPQRPKAKTAVAVRDDGKVNVVMYKQSVLAFTC
jgi:hypothetical protein